MNNQPNFDDVLNKIVTQILEQFKEKSKLIRLPLTVNLEEAKEIINLLEKMRKI